MASFASNISEFNFKRNVAKPAVVTRPFFRHLNIVALKVYRVDNTCIICFCRKWILSSGKELLHFHWLINHFRKSDQATLIRGGFEFYSLCRQAVYFSFPAPAPIDILAPIFSQSPANPIWRLDTRKMKTTKTACTAGYLRRETNLMQDVLNQSASSNHALLITKSALVIKKNALFLSQSAFSNFAPHVIRIIIYMKKLLDSDWLRAVQFKCNTPVQKV